MAEKYQPTWKARRGSTVNGLKHRAIVNQTHTFTILLETPGMSPSVITKQPKAIRATVTAVLDQADEQSPFPSS